MSAANFFGLQNQFVLQIGLLQWCLISTIQSRPESGRSLFFELLVKEGISLHCRTSVGATYWTNRYDGKNNGRKEEMSEMR